MPEDRSRLLRELVRMEVIAAIARNIPDAAELESADADALDVLCVAVERALEDGCTEAQAAQVRVADDLRALQETYRNALARITQKIGGLAERAAGDDRVNRMIGETAERLRALADTFALAQFEDDHLLLLLEHSEARGNAGIRLDAQPFVERTRETPPEPSFTFDESGLDGIIEEELGRSFFGRCAAEFLKLRAEEDGAETVGTAPEEEEEEEGSASASNLADLCQAAFPIYFVPFADVEREMDTVVNNVCRRTRELLGTLDVNDARNKVAASRVSELVENARDAACSFTRQTLDGAHVAPLLLSDETDTLRTPSDSPRTKKPWRVFQSGGERKFTGASVEKIIDEEFTQAIQRLKTRAVIAPSVVPHLSLPPSYEHDIYVTSHPDVPARREIFAKSLRENFTQMKDGLLDHMRRIFTPTRFGPVRDHPGITAVKLLFRSTVQEIDSWQRTDDWPIRNYFALRTSVDALGERIASRLGSEPLDLPAGDAEFVRELVAQSALDTLLKTFDVWQSTYPSLNPPEPGPDFACETLVAWLEQASDLHADHLARRFPDSDIRGTAVPSQQMKCMTIDVFAEREEQFLADFVQYFMDWEEKRSGKKRKHRHERDKYWYDRTRFRAEMAERGREHIAFLRREIAHGPIDMQTRVSKDDPEVADLLVGNRAENALVMAEARALAHANAQLFASVPPARLDDLPGVIAASGETRCMLVNPDASLPCPDLVKIIMKIITKPYLTEMTNRSIRGVTERGDETGVPYDRNQLLRVRDALLERLAVNREMYIPSATTDYRELRALMLHILLRLEDDVQSQEIPGDGRHVRLVKDMVCLHFRKVVAIIALQVQTIYPRLAPDPSVDRSQDHLYRFLPIERKGGSAPEKEEKQTCTEPEAAPPLPPPESTLLSPAFLAHWWQKTWEDFLRRCSLKDMPVSVAGDGGAIARALRGIGERVSGAIAQADSEGYIAHVKTFDTFIAALQQCHTQSNAITDLMEIGDAVVTVPHSGIREYFTHRIGELGARLRPLVDEREFAEGQTALRSAAPRVGALLDDAAERWRRFGEGEAAAQESPRPGTDPDAAAKRAGREEFVRAAVALAHAALDRVELSGAAPSAADAPSPGPLSPASAIAALLARIDGQRAALCAHEEPLVAACDAEAELREMERNGTEDDERLLTLKQYIGACGLGNPLKDLLILQKRVDDVCRFLANAARP